MPTCEGRGQATRFGFFTRGETALAIGWKVDCLDHRASLDVVAGRKITASSQNFTSAVQTVASQYD
jgi:hypothetical protein